MNASIDLYCERTSAIFWAEPLNAWSNLAFVLAGLWGLYMWQRKQSEDVFQKWLLILSTLTLSIGVGSFLFHTFANQWSQLADVIPIGLFMLGFVTFGFRYLAAYNKFQTGVAVGSFVLAMATVGSVVQFQWLNGSDGYLPALFTLALMNVLNRKKDRKLKKMLFFATGVFFVSLVFRTLDLALCEALPLGTHFIWHLCNGLLLGTCLTIVSKSTQTLTPYQKATAPLADSP